MGGGRGGLPAAVWCALGTFVLALAMVAWRVAAPSDGTRLEPGEVVRTADGVSIGLVGGGGDLRAGDVLLAVDGRSYAAWAEDAFVVAAPRPAWHSGDTHIYRVRRDAAVLVVPVRLEPFPFGAAVALHWGELAGGVVELGMLSVLLWRRSDSVAVRLLFVWAAAGASYRIFHSLEYQAADMVQGTGIWLYLGGGFTTIMLAVAALVHFSLLFPRPLAVLRRRWLLPALYLAPFPLFAGAAWAARFAAPDILDWLRLLRPLSSAFLLPYVIAFAAVSVARYRALRHDPVARQQLRLIMLSGILLALMDLTLVRVPRLLQIPRADPNVLSVAGMLFPISLAIAVLRYRLFDVDLIINRALVFGTLSATIAALYVGVVTGLGLLTLGDNSLFSTLPATAVVAIVFQPLRERLQRAVNRLMYGERDDPYAVLSRLGRRLDTAPVPDAVLPVIVETVATALRLPYAAIVLEPARDGPDGRAPAQEMAAFGTPAGDCLSLPLAFQHESLGRFLFAPRARGEPFSPADMALLADIARAAAAAAHAVRLTADLRRSRERIVTAREEERRRIRRDLHDGLGPALAALTLKLDAARNLAGRDTAAAQALLSELREQTQGAIADIRRLVYDLRPPALDDLGLVAALRAYAAQLSGNELQIRVEADALPPLPAATEVAVYRIVTEALTNVVRHAGARRAEVRLSCARALDVDIRDDGGGLPPGLRAGIGLISMRERAEELGGTFAIESLAGGGTRVLARLPLAG